MLLLLVLLLLPLTTRLVMTMMLVMLNFLLLALEGKRTLVCSPSCSAAVPLAALTTRLLLLPVPPVLLQALHSAG